MENKLLSVIMAAYKTVPWVEEAVKSCLNQELPAGWSMELLIGVDGCPDTLEAILGSEIMQDSRLCVFELDRNYGTYIAANTLVQHCQGEFVTRFDSDDVMLPTRLKKMTEVLINDPRVVRSNTWCDYRNTTLDRSISMEKRGADGVWMFRHSVFEALGGYQPWVCGADTELVQRTKFLPGAKAVLIPEFLYVCRTRPGSLMRNPGVHAARREVRKQLPILLDAYKKKTLPLCVTPETGIIKGYYGNYKGKAL